MLETFLSSLADLFTLQTFSFMLLGTAIGFIVGILPGLGGPVALATMLPFVFVMSPIEGFAFLLSMLAVTGTTSDITSVLLGIPGDASSVTTVLDGHPMAQRGEAGRALGIVLTTSVIGAWFGAIVLGLIMPAVRPIVLSFGPPELLMLAVLGLTFVAAIMGRSLVKGLIVVAFGLLLTTIGADPQSGIPRYSFGQLYLWEGLHIVPVVVGLFGGAEVLALIMSRSSPEYEQRNRKIVGVLQGVRDAFRHWWLALRTSAIGVGTGIMPGLGGVAAQFIAYSHAQQTSRHPEEFGRGSVEGLVAAGGANNSKEGGQLVPTVAFGIPGSGQMAILLGAFMIMGVQPGPSMLSENLDLTFSMVWIIILSNLLAVAVAFAFLRPIARVTQVDTDYLVPGLLALLTIGAFTANNSTADIVVMLASTVVGVLFIRYDWPRAPLILALVLGGEVERMFFVSHQLYGWAWVQRPIVLVLAAVAALGLLLPWLGRRRRAGKAVALAVSRQGPKFVAGQVTLGLIMAFAAGSALYLATDWPFRSRVFPVGVAGMLLLVAVVSMALDGIHLARRRAERVLAGASPRLRGSGDSAASDHSVAGADEPSTTLPPPTYQTASARLWAMGVAWLGGCYVALWLFGAWGLVLFSLVYLQYRLGSWIGALAYSAGIWAFLQFFVNGFLGVRLPSGGLPFI